MYQEDHIFRLVSPPDRPMNVFAQDNDANFFSVIKKFGELAPANILTSMSMYSIFLVNIIFAGQMEDQKILAGVAIATAVLNMTLFAISLGINFGIDTVTSAAYGAGDLQLCCTLLSRGRFINLLFTTPIAIFLAV